MSEPETSAVDPPLFELEEYIAVKQRAVEASLLSQQLRQELENTKAANSFLQESCDYLMKTLESKLHNKKQHELGMEFAESHEFDYYYAIDVVGACSVKCPSCPVGNTLSHPAKGFMSVETYTKILEKIAAENKAEKIAILLYNWGNPSCIRSCRRSFA